MCAVTPLDPPLCFSNATASAAAMLAERAHLGVPADLGENGQSYKGVAPDGIAVNTALSESYITGLAVRGTEKGFCERVTLPRHICRAVRLANPERTRVSLLQT